MAGLISSSTLEQIRAASDVVDVIGAYLPLKRAGANFVTLCPFHREKSPSFNVNPHRQIFHCFGCQKGGDVFSFVQEFENIPFIDAVRRLAERAHILLEFDNQPGQQQVRHLKETLWQIHEQVTQRWQSALTNEAGGQIAREYLQRRGVSEEAVKLFRLGYAPEAWDDTVNWAKSKSHPLGTVEQAGLILRKEGSDHFYDRFRGRLIFPICDEQGRVVAFSGRILAGDEKSAKYVNSPETPIFTKSKVFFGLDKSKRAILEAGFAIICEGQLDLIACFMAGVQNIVAPQGTAFTAEHARILKRYVDEVVLCFDSDNAGQAAAIRVLDSLLASGLAIRVATVPSPHDPDSFIKEAGGEGFRQLIAKAEGFFDFYLNRLCATNEVSTDKGRLTVVKSMAEAVLKTANSVLSDTYAQKTAQRLGVSPESVRSEFKKTPRPKAAPSQAEPDRESSPVPDQAPVPERELWLLKFILVNDEQTGWLAGHLDLSWLQNPSVRKIIAACLEAQADHSWNGVPALLSKFEDPAIRSLVTQAVAENFSSENLAQKIIDTVRLLRNDSIDRQLTALTLRLVQPGITPTEHVEIETEKSRLRHQKKQPLDS